MSFDRHHDRDRERRRPQRNSCTDIAYLIVAAAGLVLGGRLYSRVIHPWALHVVTALTWQDALPWAVVLVLVLVAAVRLWATRRRRLSPEAYARLTRPGTPEPPTRWPAAKRARRRSGSRVAEGHHDVTRSALETASSRAHAAAGVGGFKVTKPRSPTSPGFSSTGRTLSKSSQWRSRWRSSAPARVSDLAADVHERWHTATNETTTETVGGEADGSPG